MSFLFDFQTDLQSFTLLLHSCSYLKIFFHFISIIWFVLADEISSSISGIAGGIFNDDPYLHVNKRELIGGALVLGAGIAKGVILTGLINSLSSKTGIQIGKKK